jgi:putative transposase
VKYAFMAAPHGRFRLCSMYRVLKIHRSGYYVWKAAPKSKRALADVTLMVKIKRFYADSHGIYGSPRIHLDLREAGTRRGEKRVVRLMQQAQLRAARGCKRPRHKGGRPATVARIAWRSGSPLMSLIRFG